MIEDPGGLGPQPLLVSYYLVTFGVMMFLNLLISFVDNRQRQLLITFAFVAAMWAVKSVQAAGLLITLYVLLVVIDGVIRGLYRIVGARRG